MNPVPKPPAAVIAAFDLDAESLEPLASGHINLTFAALTRSGTASILQRVNPIFPAVVNDDIDKVTRHLAARGIATPEILPTRSGGNRVETEGHVWRLLTRIPGETRETIDAERTAASAAFMPGSPISPSRSHMRGPASTICRGIWLRWPKPSHTTGTIRRTRRSRHWQRRSRRRPSVSARSTPRARTWSTATRRSRT